MRCGAKIWIGADPGGTRNFGLAILKSDGSVKTCCVNCADEAIDVVKEQVKVQPAGVGVDSPLWWSSGRSSDRQADQWLRRTYGLSGGQVQTANSLRGAALVQGAMFVHRVRQLFPDVGVTEAHPKAVWTALKVDNWGTFSRQFSVNVTIQADQEHERDAIISDRSSRADFNSALLFERLTLRQAGILNSALQTKPVSVITLEDPLQAEFYNRALDKAQKLFGMGQLVPAGVLAGTVLENYLKWMCRRRNIKINEERLSTEEINDSLYKFQTYKHTTWIRIQGLIPIADACLDPKKKNPPKKEIRALISGVKKVLGNRL